MPCCLVIGLVSGALLGRRMAVSESSSSRITIIIAITIRRLMVIVLRVLMLLLLVLPPVPWMNHLPSRFDDRARHWSPGFFVSNHHQEDVTVTLCNCLVPHLWRRRFLKWHQRSNHELFEERVPSASAHKSKNTTSITRREQEAE